MAAVARSPEVKLVFSAVTLSSTKMEAKTPVTLTLLLSVTTKSTHPKLELREGQTRAEPGAIPCIVSPSVARILSLLLLSTGDRRVVMDVFVSRWLPATKSVEADMVVCW